MHCYRYAGHAGRRVMVEVKEKERKRKKKKKTCKLEYKY
jgi:hypothetical protein